MGSPNQGPTRATQNFKIHGKPTVEKVLCQITSSQITSPRKTQKKGKKGLQYHLLEPFSYDRTGNGPKVKIEAQNQSSVQLHSLKKTVTTATNNQLELL